MRLSSISRPLAVLGTVLAFAVCPHAALASSTGPASPALPARAECTYTALKISILQQFQAMIGRKLVCAQVYANAATTWAQWEKPWFIDYVNEPDLDWSAWATAAHTHRRLVITLDLFPSGLTGQDWLQQGASGAYGQYAVTLAHNLVAAGLGDSIIRLAPEMNGTWYDYSLGSTPAEWRQWDAFYANTVEAMRSVAGAHFAFDWCINAATRDLPLAEIYPGNSVVNIIGLDVYDVGANLTGTQAARWRTSYTEADGIRALLNFARSEGKPVSIPEWGIAPAADGGGGDNAIFVNGIAKVVRDNPVVYESYFYNDQYASQLAGGPRALAAYRRDFGAHGVSVDTGTDTW